MKTATLGHLCMLARFARAAKHNSSVELSDKASVWEFWESNTALHLGLASRKSWGWAKWVSRVTRLFGRFQQHWTTEGACGPEVDHRRPEVCSAQSASPVRRQRDSEEVWLKSEYQREGDVGSRGALS